MYRLDDDEKLLTEQVELSGGWFTFGSLDVEQDEYQAAMRQAEEKKANIENLQDSLGEETFEALKGQLDGMGRSDQMSTDMPGTRDGGKEADVAKVHQNHSHILK